jgi:hypothetical protein
MLNELFLSIFYLLFDLHLDGEIHCTFEFNSKSIPEGNGPSDTLQIANICAVFLNGGWRCGEMEKKCPQHTADTQDIEGMRFLRAAECPAS